jgi:hypothetical protein
MHVQHASLMQKFCADCACGSDCRASEGGEPVTTAVTIPLRAQRLLDCPVKPGNDKGGGCGYEPSFAFTSALALAKSIWPA